MIQLVINSYLESVNLKAGRRLLLLECKSLIFILGLCDFFGIVLLNASNLVRSNPVRGNFLRIIKFNLFHNYTVIIRIYLIQYMISIYNKLLYIIV